MKNAISQKVFEWNRNCKQSIDYQKISNIISFLSKNYFDYYEPAINPNIKEFDNRLIDWLNNIKKVKHQQLLFRLIPEIFYVGREEFDSLYRTAYKYNTAKWLIDSAKLNVCSSKIKREMKKAIEATWFCPITDSMKINSFYHVNQITNNLNYRPDWFSLSRFGDKRKISDYIRKNKIEYITLLEDFVGQGGQIKSTIEYAASFKKPVLVVALITCPKGKENFEALQRTYKNLTFCYVICIPESSFIFPVATHKEKNLFKQIRKMLYDLYPMISSDDPSKHSTKPPHSPFGYKNTGGLIVMYSNCPNNTIPILHYDKKKSWKSLFPRSARV